MMVMTTRSSISVKADLETGIRSLKPGRGAQSVIRASRFVERSMPMIHSSFPQTSQQQQPAHSEQHERGGFRNNTRLVMSEDRGIRKRSRINRNLIHHTLVKLSSSTVSATEREVVVARHRTQR